MVAWAPIVGGGLAAAGLLGDSGDNGEQWRQKAIDEFTKLEGRAPTAQELQAQIQKYVVAGQLSPEMAKTIDLGPSAFESMTVDPTGRQAQADALRQLSDVTQGGGLDATDRSKIGAIEDEVNTNNRGQQEAIVQNAAERGVGGSGLELASRLSAGQNNATNASRQATDVAALAQQRALAAIAAKANLGGSIRTSDYNEAATAAAARDAINKFNATNRQSVVNANVDRTNTAQAGNVGTAQDVANKNTTAANTNAVRNADVHQQVFDNAASIAAGKSGQYDAQATADAEEKRRKDAENAALIGAGGTIMSGGGR